ncbi:hypothetical protein LTS18_012754, partial [Coniosporium uncinatum]
MGMQRTASMDSNTFDQYGAMNGMNSPVYTPSPTMAMPSMAPQQLQYQQAMLAASRQGPYYPQMGMNGYHSPAPAMDAYRNVSSPLNGQAMSGASPLMPQSGFGQPAFNPMMGQQQMYQQYPMQPMQYMQPQMQHAGAGRRGR